jgi:hypothetical protein
MKHLIRFFLAGAVILALGLALGGSLRPGSGAVANAQSPGPIDGQDIPPLDTSMPDEVAAGPAALGGPTHRTYSANEFLSTHSDLTYASYGPAIYALSIPGGGFSFKLPLDLPNGSQVTSITVFLVDNTPSYNMSIQFYRVTVSTAAQIELDSVSTVGLPTSSAVQSVTMTGSPIAIINTFNYAYTIRYAPVITGNLHQMVGVRIYYIAPSIFGVALPTVLKNSP